MNHFDLVLSALQAAENAAALSTHPTNRIGAALVHPENPGFLSAACNHVPTALGALSPLEKIGASSPTVHAELTAAFAFKGDPRGSYLCLTDPFCPNCAKYMAELGVSFTFIATDGLKGDFALRRRDAFAEMSLLIAQRAGMAVGLIDRADRAIDWLIPPGLVTLNIQGGYALFDAGEGLQEAVPNLTQNNEAPWAAAVVEQRDGARTGLLVFEALPPGLTPDDLKKFNNPDLLGKYRFALDPLTRLLLVAKRQQYKILNAEVATRLVPASRALINAVGFGVQKLLVATHEMDHDPQGFEAMQQLQTMGVLKV